MMTVKIALDKNGREIFLVNTENTGSFFDGIDILYIAAGNAARIVEFDKATDNDKINAIGPDNYRVAGDLGEECYNTWYSDDWRINMTKTFYAKANEFAIETPAEELYNLIQFCKQNHNDLPEEHQVIGYRINNADDCYCSALIGLTRPQFGQNAEDKIFNALEEGKENFVKVLTEYRTLLKKISEETGKSLEDLITVTK